MPWQTLTAADIGLNHSEEKRYRESLLARGEADRLPGILASVVAQVRDAIRSARASLLDDDATTIPAGAVIHAGAIARYRLMGHFPGEISDVRTAEYREALQWLRDVAAGKYKVEPPGTDPAAPAAPAAGPKVSTPTLTQQRDHAAGS